MQRSLRIISLLCLIITVFLLIPLTAQARVIPEQQTYSVIGTPTISAAFIDKVLASNQSPAAGKGQALYALGLTYHIDPVFALAFFMHESSFGTAGVARETRSLGNLRCIADYPCPHGYALFPNWEAGFEAWYKLINDLYITTWGLTTIDQIIPRYAPAADNNDEAAYIASLKSAVDSWRNEQIAVSTPSLPPEQEQAPPAIGSTLTPTPETRYPTPDSYQIKGQPTISAAFVKKILQSYHSPVAKLSQHFYDEGVRNGIDPAIALAFFMRESIFGTVGLARVTHSITNITQPTDAACNCATLNGYRSYQRWEDGITDWYRLVRAYYVDQLSLSAVNQIVVAFAPTKNAVVVLSLTRTVERRIDLWRRQQ